MVRAHQRGNSIRWANIMRPGLPLNCGNGGDTESQCEINAIIRAERGSLEHGNSYKASHEQYGACRARGPPKCCWIFESASKGLNDKGEGSY